MNGVASMADIDAIERRTADLPTEEVDVVIVGYGPVGAAMAGLLGRYGVRTLVIDRADDIFMAPRAIALDNEALRILQMVGLPDRAFEKMNSARQAALPPPRRIRGSTHRAR